MNHFVRWLVGFVVCLLACVGMTIIGANNLYDQRRLRGTSWIAGGILVGLGGLVAFVWF